MASIARNSPACRPKHLLQSISKPQIRSLSTSQSCRAQGATGNMSAGSGINSMPKQPSMASRMKKLRRSEIPSDIGLIPNTYVRPCGNMPSWFSEPMVRARLEWLYFKQGAIDFGSGIYFNRWNQKKDPLTGKRKKIPMGFRERYRIARDLHTQLYTALAAGDRTTVSKIACSGLANEQRSRLERARIDGKPAETWTVKYRGWVLPSKLYFTLQCLIPSAFRAIHVLADRSISMPIGGAGMTLRQVFVRVDSKQTLDRNDGTDPVTKNMREYLVLQRSIVNEEMEEWKVWGTIDPTDTKTALEIVESGKAESGSMMDRLRSMFPSMP